MMARATTSGVEETEAFARRFAEQLEAGTIVLLIGELGAGKTAFVRGLAAGLGIDPDEVSSPTFTLVQEYRGRLTLQHVDLYRLEAAVDIDELGLDELAAEGGVVAVEWAERLPAVPAGALVVRIRDRGADQREIEVAGRDSGDEAERRGHRAAQSAR